MYNNLLRKITSLSLLTILLASSVAMALPNAMPPAAHAQVASHPNLFVSAENSQWNNYFAGPQVVQVIVSDPNINRLDQAYGEPVVTIGGKRLRMAQATDGNRYGYFADRNQAINAGKTAQVGGFGLNFGYFCGPNTAVGAIKQGLAYTDTKGFTIARNNQAGNGTGFPLSPFAITVGTPADCGAFTNTGVTQGAPAVEHVVRENKTLNSNSAGFGAGLGYEAIWPVIQVYDF